MIKQGLFLIMLPIIFANVAHAQFVKISGHVTDILNNPVARAWISFNNSKRYQVMTDDNGDFTTIRNKVVDSVVICRHLNYRTLAQQIENNNTVNFILFSKDEVYTLSEISDSLPLSFDSSEIIMEKRFVDSVRGDNEDKIFTRIEIDPEFTGGKNALKNYYKSNLNTGKIKLNREIAGIVTIRFTVKKDGSLADIRLLKGIQKGIDDEILKLTARSPKWKPAMQNGRYCEFSYILSIPINFKTK